MFHPFLPEDFLTSAIWIHDALVNNLEGVKVMISTIFEERVEVMF